MVVFDDMAIEKLHIHDKRAAVVNGATTLCNTGVFTPHLPETEPLVAECAHFVDCATNQKVSRSDGESGVQVVRVLEKGQQSLEDGGPVEI
jgi:UDP-2-acetamido-3-amino-2,3-dideoxy-glucuronate N-acetyltransferase